MKDITTIAFDADDTLWVNEPYFKVAEKEFCDMLSSYMPAEEISKELFSIEMQNLNLYGYGIKSFMLSMIETIGKVTNNKASIELVNKAITLGKEQLKKPVELLEGVEEVLKALQGKYRLIVATKGDLLDQERKVALSGLKDYFQHVEIMSNKKKEDYLKLLSKIDCPAENFLMLGNSLKSDVLPLIEIGAKAIHIPFHTTWAHEEVKLNEKLLQFITAHKITDILNYLDTDV